MESLESLSHGPPWLPLQTAAVLSPTQSPKELMGRELELGWCMESWNLHDTLILIWTTVLPGPGNLRCVLCMLWYVPVFMYYGLLVD